MKKLFYVTFLIVALTAIAQLRQPQSNAHNDFVRACRHAEARRWDSVGLYIDRCHKWQELRENFLPTHEDSVSYSHMLDSLTEYYGGYSGANIFNAVKFLETAKRGTEIDSVLFGTNSAQYVRHSYCLNVTRLALNDTNTIHLKEAHKTWLKQFEEIGDTLSREYQQLIKDYKDLDQEEISLPLSLKEAANKADSLVSLAENAFSNNDFDNAIKLQSQAIGLNQSILESDGHNLDDNTKEELIGLLEGRKIDLSIYLFFNEDYHATIDTLLPIAKRWTGDNEFIPNAKAILAIAYWRVDNISEAGRWARDPDVLKVLNGKPENPFDDFIKISLYSILADTSSETDEILALKTHILELSDKCEYSLYEKALLELDIIDLYRILALEGKDMADSVTPHIDSFYALFNNMEQSRDSINLNNFVNEGYLLADLGNKWINLLYNDDPTHENISIDYLIQMCDNALSFSNALINDTISFVRTNEQLLLTNALLHANKAFGLSTQIGNKLKTDNIVDYNLIEQKVAENAYSLEKLLTAKEVIDNYGQCLDAEEKEIYSINLLQTTLDIQSWMEVMGVLAEKIYKDYGNKIHTLNKYLLPQLLVAQSKQRELIWDANSKPYTSYIPRICHNAKGFGVPYGNYGVYESTYYATLFRKGLLLKIDQLMEHAIEETNDPLLIETMRRRKELDRQAHLNTEELKLRDKLEQELIDRVSNDTTMLSKFDVRWQDVQQALDTNDVAIEFLHYPILEGDSIAMAVAALKLKKESLQPEFIILHNLEDNLKIHADDGTTQDSLWYTTDCVDEWIWKPLLGDEMRSGEEYRVFFAADGPLHNIAIENSPGMTGDRHFEMHRVASTREIVDGQLPLALESAALFGDVDYKASPEEVIAANATLAHPAEFVEPTTAGYLYAAIERHEEAAKLRGGRGGLYDRLDSAAVEIDLAKKTLEGINVACRLYTQAAATEEAFKSLDGHSPSVIHLATHGCYFTPENVETERNSISLPFLSLNPRHGTAEDAALTHSFLTLAGSRELKKLSQDGSQATRLEDGHLTAQEIAGLDLHNTRLVVLSACETARGDVTSEGVLGLQRGFKRAGAGTIVMTVSEVGDAAAKDFMETFYRQLAARNGEHDALRKAFTEAQKRVRRDHPDTLDWAYFIMLD